MSNLNPPTAGPAPRWLRRIGCIALVLYAIFLTRNSSNVAGGADSSGYLNSARLIASGHVTAELRTPPEFGPQEKLRRQQFQPHGFVPFEGNPRLSPTYAVGLPLHLALAGKIFGWDIAPVLVGVGGAIAAVLLCYAIARRLGLDPWLSATGGIMLAAYPVFLFTSIQPLSDTLATTWCLAGIFTALRAREHAGWAVACGAAFAMAVLVRATNVLLLPALIVMLGFDVRRLALVVLGGLPGAAWLGYYNHALYGSALRTGYINITEAFGWTHGAPTIIHFTKWLALMLPAIVLVLPFIALARREFRTRMLLALGLWFAPFLGLYAFYEISHEVWWDLRFILPGTPALIIAALMGVESLVRRKSSMMTPRFRAMAVGLLIVWAIGLGWFWISKLHLLLTKSYEQGYADASNAARIHFPSDALVLAGMHSGALYYYTRFAVMRWEFVNPTEFAGFRTLTEKAERPICALLFDVEEREALREKCPGEWVQVSRLKNVSLWRLKPSRSAADK